MSQTADVATWVERHTPEQQSQIRWVSDRVHAADVTGEVGEMRWAGRPLVGRERPRTRRRHPVLTRENPRPNEGSTTLTVNPSTRQQEVCHEDPTTTPR
jgi:hypothetical protein